MRIKIIINHPTGEAWHFPAPLTLEKARQWWLAYKANRPFAIPPKDFWEPK